MLQPRQAGNTQDEKLQYRHLGHLNEQTTYIVQETLALSIGTKVNIPVTIANAQATLFTMKSIKIQVPLL